MKRVTLKQLPTKQAASPVTLHFGQASVLTRVARPDSSTLAVPAAVLEQWHLLPGQSLHVWQAPEQDHLHLGPLFGIAFEAPEPEVAEMRAEVITALAEAATAAHVPLLCFSMHDVDLARNVVKGRLHQGHNKWCDAETPIPDVIYNRATYPDLQLRQQASSMRTRLRKIWGVPIVNPISGFSKWTTYQVMDFFPVTRPYMPATIKLTDDRSFAAFLKRHRRVFVKANIGTWGQSVLKVSAPGQDSRDYYLTGYWRDHHLNKSFATFAGLFSYLSWVCEDAPWVVQQAIDLLTVQDRPFDLRFVFQKDAKNEWRVAQRLVNWAGPGQVVTNNRRTAEFVPVKQFQDVWPAGAADFMELVRKAEAIGYLAVEVLEAKHGMLGEVGLDVGLDQERHPWVFEANAKPFLRPGVGIYYPFEFARFLAQRCWQALYDAT